MGLVTIVSSFSVIACHAMPGVSTFKDTFMHLSMFQKCYMVSQESMNHHSCKTMNHDSNDE